MDDYQTAKVVNSGDIEGDYRSEQGMRENAISMCRNRSPVSEKLHSRVAIANV